MDLVDLATVKAWLKTNTPSERLTGTWSLVTGETTIWQYGAAISVFPYLLYANGVQLQPAAGLMALPDSQFFWSASTLYLGSTTDPATRWTDIQCYLQVTIDDALLSSLITQTSEYVRSMLSRDLDSRTYTEALDGTGSDTIFLGNYPITDVASLQVEGVAVAPSPGYRQTGFVFDPTTVTLCNVVFPKGKKNITITYTAGFTTIPADLQHVTMSLVGKKYRERDRIGQSSKTLAGEIVSFSPSDLTDELKSQLRNYQKVVPA